MTLDDNETSPRQNILLDEIFGEVNAVANVYLAQKASKSMTYLKMVLT